jgi:membrane-associated phospholipid phosphatase
MSQAIIVDGIWTFAIKLAAQRERPNMENNKSFPSGHASEAFAWATVIGRHYGPKGGIPAYAVATFIATSRMAKNAHWLSDVVAGSALGFGIGRAVVRRNSRPPTPAGGPTPPQPDKPSGLELRPDFGPAADGVGLQLQLRF